jgi:hypothetical protein
VARTTQVWPADLPLVRNPWHLATLATRAHSVSKRMRA